jgi:single-stranded-DNA-specific exonuclease
MAKSWHLMPLQLAQADELGRRLRISPIVAQLLLNRGLAEPAQIEHFLTIPFKDLLDPEGLPGAVAAADRLLAAASDREPICVYGDYDADGLTGTAILVELLGRLGALVDYYIPHRLDEGYGLNSAALRNLAAAGTKIIVTVDCGIANVDEAEEARGLGLDLIVTDHHEPRRSLPNASIIIHPRIPCGAYPFGDLSGSGVAFKLAWAICQRASGSRRVTPDFREFLLDSVTLAALGMIADCVPLHNENRIIVSHGLARLARTKNLGLRALLAVSGMSDKSDIRASDVGFGLAPRLNAAGRLGCARLVVELMTMRSWNEALELAAVLDRHNRMRQQIERTILEEALSMIEEGALHRDAALVLANPGWHAGVIGIVAGRLLEQFGKPALLIAVSEVRNVGQGSGRSTHALALHTAMEACSEHLLSHGGHAAAAGFRVLPSRIDDFRRRFLEYATAQSSSLDLGPILTIDAEVPLSSITSGLIDSLARLEPHGAGNPRPRFLTGPVQVVGEPRLVGRDLRHLRLRVRQNGTILPAIAFGMATRTDELMSAGGECCLVFTPSINEWQGFRHVQLEIADFQPGDCAHLGPQLAAGNWAR